MATTENTVRKGSQHYTGDACCVRLCNDAMQIPLYDIDDDSNLGDIINDHADRAMTPAEVAEFNAWAAQQNCPITSSPSALRFVGDLDCERLCDNAMQSDSFDHSDLLDELEVLRAVQQELDEDDEAWIDDFKDFCAEEENDIC